MLNMVIRAIFGFFLLVLTGCGDAMSAGYTEAEAIERAVKKLNAASRWMIENGITEILTNPSYADSLRRTLIDQFRVTQLTKPGLDNEDELARFIVKSYAIHYDINLLKRILYKGSIYEYWMIFTSSQSWPQYDSDCQFFVTQSDSIKSRRKIIKESGQFFHQYMEGNTLVISLDYENDLFIRYNLGAWIVPESYKNYPRITQKQVIIDDNGNYAFAP